MEKIKKSSPRGLKLAFLRKKLALTQGEFGRRFGFKEQQIGHIERTGNIPAALLNALQKAGYDVRDLIAEESERYGGPIDETTEKVIEELLRSGDEEILQHLKRQVLLLKDLLDYRSGRR